MSGSISISSGNEGDLQSAVANVGPIAVAVDASSNGFRVRPISSSLYENGCFCINFIDKTEKGLKFG